MKTNKVLSIFISAAVICASSFSYASDSEYVGALQNLADYDKVASIPATEDELTEKQGAILPVVVAIGASWVAGKLICKYAYKGKGGGRGIFGGLTCYNTAK